jgi:hypothetical protein
MSVADEGGLSDEQLYGLKDGEVSTGVSLINVLFDEVSD